MRARSRRRRALRLAAFLGASGARRWCALEPACREPVVSHRRSQSTACCYAYCRALDDGRQGAAVRRMPMRWRKCWPAFDPAAAKALPDASGARFRRGPLAGASLRLGRRDATSPGSRSIRPAALPAVGTVTRCWSRPARSMRSWGIWACGLADAARCMIRRMAGR